jgi:hypothetical protein
MENGTAPSVIDPSMQEQAAPSKRKQNFFAVVMTGIEVTSPLIIEAPNRKELKKLISCNDEIVDVLAIFRGHRVRFEEKRAINFF